jgi:hypothetical protein
MVGAHAAMAALDKKRFEIEIRRYRSTASTQSARSN